MINIYEVMKLKDNLPLFFKEHIERLEQSIRKYKPYSSPELQTIAIEIIKPLLKSPGKNNIKLTYSVEEDNFSAELIPNRTPDPTLYLHGAAVGIYDGEREDPLIKRENRAFRAITEELCRESGFYDLLLKNREGFITEGTRSNFLLISTDGEVVSSPLGDALKGVTRDQVFAVCRKKSIPVVETDITENILAKADSMIITGTSPGILPIINCGELRFSVDNPIIRQLIEGYEEAIKNSLEEAMEVF